MTPNRRLRSTTFPTTTTPPVATTAPTTPVSPLSRRLTTLQSDLALLQPSSPTPPPITVLLHLASLSPHRAARALLHRSRRAPPHVLLATANLCVTAPVGRIGDRRALRATAILILDALLAANPTHVGALCLKGELLLPFIHYGRNELRVPRAVLQEAYHLFEEAGDAPLPTFLKGRWLLTMEPLHRNATEAAHGRACVKKAAAQLCARALVFLAHRYEYPQLDRTVSFASDVPKGKMAKERFILGFYMNAAEANDPDALNDIGTSYAEGYGGLNCDFDSAVDYYVRAIDNGSLHAFDNLGTHYETGMGGRFPDRVDFQRALYYYRQGARQRCPKCAYNLGAAHEEGMNGVLPRDGVRAEHYYRLSIKLADDCNDMLTASRSVKDLVSLYLTRVKMARPSDHACMRAKSRLLDLLVEQYAVDAVLAKLNKAVAAASKGKNAALSRLLGDVNSKMVIARLRQLEVSAKAADAESTVLLNHVLGIGESVPDSVARKKRTRSRRPAAKKRRRH